jgi:hypothetical protein
MGTVGEIHPPLEVRGGRGGCCRFPSEHSPVLVYVENPYWFRTWQCNIVAPLVVGSGRVGRGGGGRRPRRRGGRGGRGVEATAAVTAQVAPALGGGGGGGGGDDSYDSDDWL